MGSGFDTVAVVGLGLMGASLVHALQRQSDRPRLIGLERSVLELNDPAREGLVDLATADPYEAFRDAGLIVYATPLGETERLLGEHPRFWPEHARVTDLGSVKLPIVKAVQALGLESRFVGSHPMAGDHRRGPGAARADLFDEATVWLTPTRPQGQALAGAAEEADTDPVSRVDRFWRYLGAVPCIIDPAEHDRLMAWVSHLPQLTASGLGVALARAGVLPTEMGPGGSDTTRLAASSPDLWVEILQANRQMLREPVAALLDALGRIATALDMADGTALRQALAEAQEWRGT